LTFACVPVKAIDDAAAVTGLWYPVTVESPVDDVMDRLPAVVDSVTSTVSEAAKSLTALDPTPILVAVPALTPALDGRVRVTPVIVNELEVPDASRSAENVRVPAVAGAPDTVRFVNVAIPDASVTAVAFDSVADPDVALNEAVTVTPDSATADPLPSTTWTFGTVDQPVRTP
jgi:hypothetical protein